MRVEAQTTLVDNLKEMFKPAPDEVTLQHIVDLYRPDEGDEDYHCNCDDLDIQVELEDTRYSWYNFKLWKHGKTKSYSYSGDEDKSPDLEMWIDKEDGKIRNIKTLARRFADVSESYYDEDAQLYLMYCNRTKISDIKEQYEDLDLDTSTDPYD